MTNFVLTGLPDFIIIGEPWQPTRPRPGCEPVHVDNDFAEVLRLLGASYDGPELTDHIVYSERGVVALREFWTVLSSNVAPTRLPSCMDSSTTATA